jgi:2'-5' RNA ligase
VRQALCRLVDSLPVVRRGRLVAPDNLHLTVVFLGGTDLIRRECAERVAGCANITRFHLVLDQAGYWKRPQVFWAGAVNTPDPLLALVRHLNAGLLECGFVPDSRTYQAHVTLARKVPRGPRDPLPIDPIEWQVERFCLVRSLTERSGVRYQILRSWEFR